MDIAASGGASLRPRDVLEINVTKDQLDLKFEANFFVPRLVVAITEIREQYGIKSRENSYDSALGIFVASTLSLFPANLLHYYDILLFTLTL